MTRHPLVPNHSLRSSIATAALMSSILGCVAPSSDSSNSSSSIWASAQSDSVTGACLSGTASVVGLSDTAISLNGNASVRGSVVLMGGSTLVLSGNASVEDQVYVHSADSITKNGNASVGEVVLDDRTDREPAVLDFANALSELTPTQEFDNISGGVVAGNGGLNVIGVHHGIRISGQRNLVLSGSENDQFIFLVENGGISLSGGAGVVLSGTVSSRKVLFLVMGNNSISVSGNGSLAGTFMVPGGSATVSGNGSVEGALLAKGYIALSGNGLSFTPAAWCPQIVLPSPSPSPSVSPTPDPTTSPSATPTVDPSSSPTPDPSTSPSATPTADPSASPSPSPTACTGPFCGSIIGS